MIKEFPQWKVEIEKAISDLQRYVKEEHSYLNKLADKIKEIGAKAPEIKSILDGIELIDGDDKFYFQELVGLISDEIVTFKTEIEKRDERIHALNSQLGEQGNKPQ